MTTESTEDKAIQDTSEVKELTTSQNLFGKDYNLTKKEEASLPEEIPNEVASVSKTEEPSSTDTKDKESKHLALEEFGDYLIELNVDGEKQEVKLKDVVRSTQTDKYLTQKGQKIAEEYRELEKAKNTVTTQPRPEVIAGADEVDDYSNGSLEPTDPRIATLTRQVEALTESLSTINTTMAPTVYEQHIRSIDALLKSEGHDDFMEFKQEIENHFLTLPIEKQATLGTSDMISKYKDLKIAKMTKTQLEIANKPAEERTAPTIVNIHSGTGRPSGADEGDTKYANAFKRAQKTNDWTEVLELGGHL